jgi:hypothetical protein
VSRSLTTTFDRGRTLSQTSLYLSLDVDLGLSHWVYRAREILRTLKERHDILLLLPHQTLQTSVSEWLLPCATRGRWRVNQRVRSHGRLFAPGTTNPMNSFDILADAARQMGDDLYQKSQHPHSTISGNALLQPWQRQSVSVATRENGTRG